MATDARRGAGVSLGPTAQRALALGLLVLLLALAWAAVAAPLLALHAERAETIVLQRRLAQRMAAMIETLPALRAEGSRDGPAAVALLDGGSDALAGATLQQQVQELAARAQVTLASLEILPPDAAAGYRRISLRVSATAGWAQLVDMLRAMRVAQPDLVVDGLMARSTLPAGTRVAGPSGPPVEAAFTVRAFRRDDQPATAAAGTPR